jgi:hydrogenase small subunit
MQTGILALNAAAAASREPEPGRTFTVVAAEAQAALAPGAPNRKHGAQSPPVRFRRPPGAGKFFPAKQALARVARCFPERVPQLARDLSEESHPPRHPGNCKHEARRQPPMETFYEVMRRQGISRRSFLKYCSLTATSLGLGPAFVPQIAHAMETKPRTPVLWLHGLECTCCSESFIRSAHPLAKDVVLSMISLDYDDTLMAAAGHQAEAILEEIMAKYKGNYILAVEGNPPLNQDGMSCIIGGKPFIDQLKHVAKDAKAIISWGSCASWGCVQAAKPNPTQATPVHKVIFDKPIIKVPGCPPIAEVMTGVITYMLTFDRIPELDRQGRPKMFYSQRIHDKCYRRPHFDAGQFVEAWDDESARKGYCLYKVGCKGPTTYNACSTVQWNEGTSFPIKAGHGCIGCSEDGFWDKGSFYNRLTDIHQFGIEANADQVGGVAAGAVGAAAVAHAAASAIKRAAQSREQSNDTTTKA